MHAVRTLALLLLMTASTAQAADDSTPNTGDNNGTGVPSSSNAGTGSTPDTASPS